MQVTFDLPRVLHLLLLISLTAVGGTLLVTRYNWNGLSAYGFVCTIVCQVSGAVLKIRDGSLGEMVAGISGETKTKERALRGAGGNPKKKQRKKTA